MLAGLSFSSAAYADAGCDAERLELQQYELEIIALAESMSLCDMQEASVRLSSGYAAYYRRCVPGSEGESEAQRYEQAAAASQNSAKNSCSH
jgi:hypothetical protein